MMVKIASDEIDQISQACLKYQKLTGEIALMNHLAASQTLTVRSLRSSHSQTNPYSSSDDFDSRRSGYDDRRRPGGYNRGNFLKKPSNQPFNFFYQIKVRETITDAMITGATITGATTIDAMITGVMITGVMILNKLVFYFI